LALPLAARVALVAAPTYAYTPCGATPL